MMQTERLFPMSGLLSSFKWALSGIWEATRTQRNMKIHWAAAVGMGALAVGLAVFRPKIAERLGVGRF